MRFRFLPLVLFAFVLFAGASPVDAQAGQTPLVRDLQKLTDSVAVTGYESAATAYLKQQLAALHPRLDSMGNLTVTLGAGAPNRLLAAAIDEPGYVVSEIAQDGYLRVQRLPQAGLPPHYNEMQNAQPMVITARDGRPVAAVTAGLSIHLEPGRAHIPDPDDIDGLYVDMGARTREEVLHAGVDVLSPIAAERHLLSVGKTQWSGTAVGDRFGAAALLAIARALQGTTPKGTITIAFVVQQWSGSRGLTRVLEELHPDELIFVGRPRAIVSRSADTSAKPVPPDPGSGIWAYDAAGQDDTLTQEMAGKDPQIHRTAAAPLLARGYGSAVALPHRTVHLGIPLAWPLTAGETLDERDLEHLTRSLADYLGMSLPEAQPQPSVAIAYSQLPPRPTATPDVESILKTLSLTYGVSGNEAMPRHAVEQLLPGWAHPETDASGNLILHLGPATAHGIVVMAHTDELGFRIRAILPDGALDLENKGGGTPAFYWGHPAVVHTSLGMRGAVVALPEGYDTAAFQFPSDFRASAKLHVGATDPQGVAGLGIKAGDTVTIPKRYLALAGRRVSIRSLDDRVGCAAMIHAVWALGPSFKKDVTFVWSTREELGLEGAGEYAAAAAKTGHIPSTIFAIDTFVSSDSPLESHRFADAHLGQGFVIRAIDNSNIVPWKDVQRLQSLAATHRIPIQYGVTGGGNDGSAFLRYGSTDVALSWPLRYSHSPAEVIDLRDLEALAAITETVAREW